MGILKQKLFMAIILNFIIFALEIVGLVLSVQRHGILVFTFYTECSNYFALLVSLFFIIGGIIALKKKTPLPRCLHTLRFISTVCLMITFIVSIFVIIPFQPSMSTYMLFEGSSLYQHLLCPLLSLFSFVILERQSPFPKRVIFYALIPTLIYGITLVTLNLARVITGPYPFFYFFEVPWQFSTFGCLGILVISTIVTLLLFGVHNKKAATITEASESLTF